MSWKDKAREWGGGDITFLSEDGECITFAVVGEPELIVGKFGKAQTKRAGIPVVTIEGYTLLIVGMRIFRKLAKHCDGFDSKVFEIVRHGESGDTNTKYEFSVVEDPGVIETILEIAAKPIDPDEIAASIEAATSAANG